MLLHLATLQPPGKHYANEEEMNAAGEKVIALEQPGMNFHSINEVSEEIPTFNCMSANLLRHRSHFLSFF